MGSMRIHLTSIDVPESWCHHTTPPTATNKRGVERDLDGHLTQTRRKARRSAYGTQLIHTMIFFPVSEMYRLGSTAFFRHRKHVFPIPNISRPPIAFQLDRWVPQRHNARPKRPHPVPTSGKHSSLRACSTPEGSLLFLTWFNVLLHPDLGPIPRHQGHGQSGPCASRLRPRFISQQQHNHPLVRVIDCKSV